ncbi:MULTISPECIES: Hint domain-containing protein [unclassified Ruegeria]|uniref:Hint domain-containing protein n=1 Tax=unclassified Ruegeria TaxID=2625375 RepID=UPI001AD9740C|nr:MULTISPECIES: Hint domain-containing protein [unclassified Ruegeria]MBO9410116.1 Hint domain-containing protein [Ruegeria sp. R8_1]MBO9414665.1 Hint domain-containing protein [Ruegeria sp. R8_2]
MPRINGTNSGDDIDVTNDSGTLNGTPQGSPIDNIRGRGGDDDITVTDSTISDNVVGNRGDDNIVISNSTVVGRVSGGANSDTITVSGSNVGSIRLGAGNDTLNFSSTTVSDDVVGGSGTDTLNLPEGTVVNDATFGTFTVEAGVAYSVSSGTFTLPSGATVTYSAFENGSGVPCFTRNTKILTPKGDRCIQTLRVGEEVLTLGQGVQALRWIGRRSIFKADLQANPRLRPVRISAGALGDGLPHEDLLVSRQHRMLVRSRIAQRMFGAPEVLVAAIRLVDTPGIYVDENVDEVEYFHLLFDEHQVVFAAGAPTESLFTGVEALRALDPNARREIFEIFPDLAKGLPTRETARLIPEARQQARLLERHRKNAKPLLWSQAGPAG